MNLNLILISLTFFVCIGNDEDGVKFRLSKGNKSYFNLILIYLYWLYHFKCIGEDDEGIKFGIFPAFHLGLKTTWLFVRDGDIGASLSRPLCFTSECWMGRKIVRPLVSQWVLSLPCWLLKSSVNFVIVTKTNSPVDCWGKKVESQACLFLWANSGAGCEPDLLVRISPECTRGNKTNGW